MDAYAYWIILRHAMLRIAAQDEVAEEPTLGVTDALLRARITGGAV
jgi:hypothetical protein